MTPLQCECGWHGDESEAKLPDVRPEEAEADNQICPKCESELFEVLVAGVNYKVDANGIIRDAVVKAVGLGLLAASGGAFVAAMVWG